jgi:hypothetical protein
MIRYSNPDANSDTFESQIVSSSPSLMGATMIKSKHPVYGKKQLKYSPSAVFFAELQLTFVMPDRAVFTRPVQIHPRSDLVPLLKIPFASFSFSTTFSDLASSGTQNANSPESEMLKSASCLTHGWLTPQAIGSTGMTILGGVVVGRRS